MKAKLLMLLLGTCLLALTAWLVHVPGPARADDIPAKYRDTVHKGLEYLVKQQFPDGHWEGDGGKHPVAMTGLVGLALLMEKDNPKRQPFGGFSEKAAKPKYAANIRKAADWLMEKSQPRRDGLIFSEHPSETNRYSLAVNGDCLIVTGGNALPCPLMVVRAPSSKGAPAQTIWSNRFRGGNIVSPVCWDGRLFSVSHLGILTCQDAESGLAHWSMRLGSRCLASLVAGDGKVYALDQEGTLHVVAADATGTLLATQALLEHCSATPAIAASVLFVRTSGHVCCIGSGE